MKKRLCLWICLILLTVAFEGCSCHNSVPLENVELKNIKTIEVFTGSVPSTAKKKTVTREEDIKRILNELNRLKIHREADVQDIKAGGIGTQFQINFKDGSSLVISKNSDLLKTLKGFYVVDESSLDTENFWNSLDYDPCSIPEQDVPSII